MSTYQPHPGSVASRVITYLAGKPPGFTATNAELSHALGAPAGSFAGNLNLAVNAGLVHKRLEGRETVWCAGSRGSGLCPPTAAPAPTGEADQASPDAAAPIPDGAPDTDTTLIEQIKAAWPGPATGAAPDPAFACALFNDGRLYLEMGEETMTLQVEHTRALLAYLDRVAMP